MSFLVNGKPRALPARTINPLSAFPPAYMADKAERVLRRLAAGDHVPQWQLEVIWSKVRCDANRTPGFNDMDLPTAKCLWRREHQDRRYALRCPFAPTSHGKDAHTWGWRSVMHAHRTLAILKAARTIPADKRVTLLCEYQDAVHRWDYSQRTHARTYGVELPMRQLADSQGACAYRTEFSPVPAGMSESEFWGR